jgi:hypothetical protein
VATVVTATTVRPPAPRSKVIAQSTNMATTTRGDGFAALGDIPASPSVTSAPVAAVAPSPAAAASSPPAPSTTTTTAPPSALDVVLWGDSLAWESAAIFEWGVEQWGHNAETRTRGGTAPCDWLDDITTWQDTKPLDVAVLEFSGNASTPCMYDEQGHGLGGAERVAKYRADVEAAVVHLRDRGAIVYLIGPPVFRGDAHPGRVEALLELYQELADRHDGVSFVNSGEAVLADGTYTDRLPCAPWEDEARGCVDGTIAVRSPDGIHLCPIRLSRDGCRVYSSGGWRFAMAMADAATNLRQ